jgi:RNA polymerase sigma-70 factor (ECF subfamily)
MSNAEAFSKARPQILSVAYRMLGSRAEAEDVVQDAYLRFAAADIEALRSVSAWLTRVVTRLCLDRLKSAQATREVYIGPWLPEPVCTTEQNLASVPADPEAISMAFLVLLESLTPLERASYLLADVFDYGFAEIANILGRDEAACRQLARRARAHIEERRPRFAPSRDAHERILLGFAQACQTGDLPGLEKMLADDVVTWSDGGGQVPALRKPVQGAAHVARALLGLARKGAQGLQMEVAEINGSLALVARRNGVPAVVLTLENDGVKIYAIHIVVNPDKLAFL